MKKPDIEYPCNWSYRIIGGSEPAMRQAVGEILKGADYILAESNRNASGKYISLKLETPVENQEDRDALFRALNASDSVKMVL